MREIKFRAWDKVQKRMFDVYGLGRDFVTEDTLDGVDLGKNCFSGDFVNDLVIMQFTGLLDKNGKEIYEGDVVSHFGKFRHEVKFKYGSFGYDGQIEEDFISYERNSFNLGLSVDKIEKVEVIGNIYESPELLNN